MQWHDETPWRRRNKKCAETMEDRLKEIEERCRAGDIGLRDAIQAACAVGKAHEQTRLIPGANATKE